jgi:NADH-quinone oxidoreductase subunit M
MFIISLLLLPFIFSLILFLIKDNFLSRRIALVISLLELIHGVFVLVGFNKSYSSSPVFETDWIPSMGIRFAFGMDGLSLLLVLLTVVLVPFIILSTFNRKDPFPSAFYALILLMQSALIGVFTTTDAFLFYIFWEMALIPIYFICAIWGGENKIRITLKFFIYTMLGSLFMLASLIYLYLYTPLPHSFSIHAITSVVLAPAQQFWIFAGFFLAFAIKIPVFPFHSWQPDTYTVAPSAGSMLLAGIMLKMGIYGLLRFLIPAASGIIVNIAPYVIPLALIGLLYGSVIAIKQKEIKRLIAYSSLAHVGLMTAAVFSLTIDGLQGTVYQMLSHGVNVMALFFIAEIIQNRCETTNISELGGIAKSAPRFAVFFMIVMLGAVALPLTNGFIGEFLMLLGLAKYNLWIAAIAGLSVILGAVYMLRLYQHSMYGESNALTSAFRDLSLVEMTIAVPITIIILTMGIFPKPLLEITQPVIQQILINIH